MAVNDEHEGPGDAGGAEGVAGAVENAGMEIPAGAGADTEAPTGTVASVEVCGEALEETPAPTLWERASCGQCHLVEAPLGNLVDGPEVVEERELAERKPGGTEASVGAVEGASAATPAEAPGTVEIRFML